MNYKHLSIEERTIVVRKYTGFACTLRSSNRK